MDKKLDLRTLISGSLVAILLAVFGWQIQRINAVETRMTANENANLEIRVQLSQIQTDIAWIKMKLGGDSRLITTK